MGIELLPRGDDDDGEIRRQESLQTITRDRRRRARPYFYAAARTLADVKHHGNRFKSFSVEFGPEGEAGTEETFLGFLFSLQRCYLNS